MHLQSPDPQPKKTIGACGRDCSTCGLRLCAPEPASAEAAPAAHATGSAAGGQR